MADNRPLGLGSQPLAKRLDIGVLALQGAFREHRQHLEGLGAVVREVRLPADLAGLDGLILPGGESTTMTKLLTDYDLWSPIRAFYAAGGVLWGTCAGAILLAREVQGAPPQFGGQQHSLGLLDVTVQRNAFGRQIHSFTTELELSGIGDRVQATFIRAPAFAHLGQGVEVVGRFEGQVVAVAAPQLLATAFHPELTTDSRVHQAFLTMVGAASTKREQ